VWPRGWTTSNIARTFRPGRPVVRALDEASHRGYQAWHRAYEDKVVDWLVRNPEATQEQFLRFLRDIYARPEM